MSSSSDGEEIERKISNVSIDDQRTFSKKSSFSSIISDNFLKSNKSTDLSDSYSSDRSYQESLAERSQDVSGRQSSYISSLSREKTQNNSFFENSSRGNSAKNKSEKKISRGSTNISVNSNLSSVKNSLREKTESFVSNPSFDDKYSIDDFEKEDSLLAERGGKFEFIETESIKLTTCQSNSFNKLNLDSKRTGKKCDYQHIQSKYAMPELQREMKKKRVSIIQMRKQEEKIRMQLEQKERQETAERSFQKWLDEKNEFKKKCDEKKSDTKQLKKPSFDKERSELAQQAFNEWLQLKRANQKREMEMEKLRLADEAQYCITRDKMMCNKAFKEWLQKKCASNEKKRLNERSSKQITSKFPVSMY
ncbi:coiled-coil domain-containing protein 181 [Hydra vulgaris]|uniref:coiled-coil domain-containing protein 181 n=1 Tax=Hydra vulgaris TaxID=6087 RepID=UPI0002B427CC|nr:coiled-coil domain-containing protein 181 [Hydra vulgaris]